MLLGYDNRSKRYRIPTINNRIIVSKTVKFLENEENSVKQDSEEIKHPFGEIKIDLN